MLDPGELGQLALPRADWEAKIGRGKLNIDFYFLFIFYRRVNIADAKNNGEKCAKLRIIELAETEPCNSVCNPSPGVFNV